MNTKSEYHKLGPFIGLGIQYGISLTEMYFFSMMLGAELVGMTFDSFYFPSRQRPHRWDTARIRTTAQVVRLLETGSSPYKYVIRLL